MTRTLSANALEQIYKQHMEHVPLWLFTITHDDLPEPLRLVNNTVDIISRGETFFKSGFDVTLPPEDGKTIPSLKITIDNVDRTIINTVRALLTPPKATLEFIYDNSPDLVEYTLQNAKLTDVSFDAVQVTGTFGFDTQVGVPFPPDSYTPNEFPGMFK